GRRLRPKAVAGVRVGPFCAHFVCRQSTSKMLVGRDSLEGNLPFELTSLPGCVDTVSWKLGILPDSAGGLPARRIHRQHADATGLAFHRNALQLRKCRSNPSLTFRKNRIFRFRICLMEFSNRTRAAHAQASPSVI